MPPVAYCDKQFFQDIITGKKGLLRPHQCNPVDVMRFKEFNVQAVLKLIGESDTAKFVVPDCWFKPKAKVNR